MCCTQRHLRSDKPEQSDFCQTYLATATALALAGCGGDSDYDDPVPPPPAPPAVPGDVFVLTASNKLASFNRDSAATIRSNVAITGLAAGESLVGIDFGPADGLLYGVSSAGRLYTIDTSTAAATLKSTLTADAADTTLPYASLSGAQFGVDFNPAAERLRIVSDTGQNLRVNVDSGAVTTDGAINGGPANAAVTASAYTNSFATTANTFLYAIDSANGTLFTQNPPNNGTLSLPVTLGVTASGVSGFDIDAVTNTGYAAFTVGGVRNFYSINLAASGHAATVIGAVGVTEDVRGLADDGRLISFATLTPNTLTSVAITGLAAGETVLGIDFRPKDRLLSALSSAGKIYTVDPATGAATAKATLAADAADTTNPFAAIGGTAFDIAGGTNGLALAALRTTAGGPSSLYRIDLATGAATLVDGEATPATSVVGTGVGLRDIAISVR